MKNETDDLTPDNATHNLICVHAFGKARTTYVQKCHILKEMPDGKRLKVLAFGRLFWSESDSFSKIRYVDKNRVIKK